jgi:hypothetical protein
VPTRSTVMRTADAVYISVRCVTATIHWMDLHEPVQGFTLQRPEICSERADLGPTARTVAMYLFT